MGGLFSGFQEHRTDALVRLAYDIKQVKLNIASNNSRRRKTRLYLSWMYLLVPVTVVACMFGMHISWWLAVIYASPLVLGSESVKLDASIQWRNYEYVVVPQGKAIFGIIVAVNYLIKWHYDRVLSENQSRLTSLKDEKRKVLEDIKNTENYLVAKELLDKFDNSDEETADNVPLVRGAHGPSMA